MIFISTSSSSLSLSMSALHTHVQQTLRALSSPRIALVKLINNNLMNENIYTTTTSQSSALRMKRWKDKCRRLKPLYFPIHPLPHFNDTFYVHRAHCGKNHATTLEACNFKTFCLITKKLSWNFFVARHTKKWVLAWCKAVECERNKSENQLKLVKHC